MVSNRYPCEENHSLVFSDVDWLATCRIEVDTILKTSCQRFQSLLFLPFKFFEQHRPIPIGVGSRLLVALLKSLYYQRLCYSYYTLFEFSIISCYC